MKFNKATIINISIIALILIICYVLYNIRLHELFTDTPAPNTPTVTVSTGITLPSIMPTDMPSIMPSTMPSMMPSTMPSMMPSYSVTNSSNGSRGNDRGTLNVYNPVVYKSL